MGDVVAFIRPSEPQPADGGVIHIWMRGPSDFEIGHESRSGNSWGSFEDFTSAADAIIGAHRLNRENYGGQAEVYISTPVLTFLGSGGDAA